MQQVCSNVLDPVIWPAAGLKEIDFIVESRFNSKRRTEGELLIQFGAHEVYEVEWANNEHKRPSHVIAEGMKNMPRNLRWKS